MQDKMYQGKLIKNNENSDKFFLAYSELLPNCPLFKAKLFEFFDFDIERVFNVDKNDLKIFSEFNNNVSVPKNFLSELNKLNPDKIYNYYKEKDISYITYNDENYPSSLKNIPDFPALLFYKGNIKQNFDRGISIVGSRKATESSKQNVRNIVSGFQNTDVVIVSGLASGIDSAAHRSALEFNLKTTAIIGSGLKFKYPSENEKLYREIVDKDGLIISEYPFEYPPLSYNFPQRNRIITGLTKATIIAEAKLKSGAMISARFAIEQNRELMCIPGAISNPNCEGIYHLLKTNSASIITNTKDILDILNWDVTPIIPKKTNLSGLEAIIFETISKEEISIEGLKQKLDVGINELVEKLTEMELNGLIIQKNGFYYISGI